MSDTALNKIIQYGTAAERVAFTPTPAGSSQVLYIWYETDNAPDTYVWDGSAWVLINSSGITELTGDVTAGPGTGSQAATIANDAVTFAKMQDITGDRLLGRNDAAPGNVEEISLSNGLEFDTNTLRTKAAIRTTTIGVTVDAGADVIAAGQKGYRSFPVAGTIIAWRLLADQAGDVDFDVTLDDFASYPPTTSILTPSLSGVDHDEATGLSQAVVAGDVFGFEITGLPIDIQRVTLELTIVVTG